MSLVKRNKTSKKFYKKLKNFSTASIEIGSSESSINEFNLILDGIFKMVVIKYKGQNKIIPTNYRNFKITKNEDTIKVINYNKKALKNNLLFEYLGSIIIQSVRVYKWGKRSQLVNFKKPLETTNISKDNNLMSSDVDFSIKIDNKQDPSSINKKIARDALLEKKLRRYNGI